MFLTTYTGGGGRLDTSDTCCCHQTIPKTRQTIDKLLNAPFIATYDIFREPASTKVVEVARRSFWCVGNLFTRIVTSALERNGPTSAAMITLRSGGLINPVDNHSRRISPQGAAWVASSRIPPQNCPTNSFSP